VPTDFAGCGAVVSDSAAQKTDVVIVGGGAAGFFAAIHCAEANPDRMVTILEKGPQVLTKVLVSGGGRCNVTHSCFEPRELVKRYPRGERELLGPFHSWQPQDTVTWFTDRGVALKTEADGRMFPTTDRSQTIADCLLAAARAAGVRVTTSTPVRGIEGGKDGRIRIMGEKGRSWVASRVMIATGGLKAGPIMNSLMGFGHAIRPLAPSLFTFKISDQRLSGLQGLSVDDVSVSIPGTELQESGPLLVTHWGLSGPAVLKLSAWGARELSGTSYEFVCRVNWTGALSGDQVGGELRALKHGQGRKRISAAPLFGLPRRIWERLVTAAGISDSLTWSQVDGNRLRALVEQLTAGDFSVKGKSMNKEEFVTCGGVDLREVNFKTMASRMVSGLYFGGEVLDIDALTGGFNFQAAWTTGRLAGLAMAAD
jgi:predicted Rossmann fold flavoprotein